MNFNTPVTALSIAAILATGCGKKDADTGDTDDSSDLDATGGDAVEIFEGLGYWFLEFERDMDRDVSTMECDENFTDAKCNEDDSSQDTAWTYTGSSENSPGASVVQILKGLDGKYYLYFDGRIFPGEKVGGSDDEGDTDSNVRAASAEFEFGWWGSSTSESGQEHVSGYMYDYSAAEGAGYNFKLTLDLDEGTVEGDFDMSGEMTRTWSESDEWEPQARGTYGNIPSSSYLENVDSGEGGYIYNYRTSDECSGDTCTLEIVQKWREAYKVTGGFLSEDDGEGIDGDVDGLGWDDGVPSF